MNAMLFSQKGGLFLFISLLLLSCSKEELSESTTIEQTLPNSEKLSTTMTDDVSSCSSFFYSQFGTGSVYINSTNYKILSSTAIQSESQFTVTANYEIGLSKEDLPATIIINISGNEQIFKDVNPGTSVTHTVDLPTGYKGGDEIIYLVEQKVYLEPVRIERTYTLTSPCPVELGTERFGGLVAHIFQPGEDGYIEGQTHGIIVNITSLYPVALSWNDAIEYASNLDDNYYYDWVLPTIEDLEKVMLSTGYFGYNPSYHQGYWSSTEYEPNSIYAYAGTLTGGVLSIPVSFEPQPFAKSNAGLLVRTVRYF